MYAATAVAALGLALAGGRARGLALWALLAAVLVTRAVREEGVLRERFAGDWNDYAQRTLGFLPPRRSHG